MMDHLILWIPAACRKIGLVLGVVMMVGIGVLSLPVAEAQDTHQSHRGQGKERYNRSRWTCEIPDVRLVDRSGDKVSLRSLLNSGPVMMQFNLTTDVTIGPVLSAIFSVAQKKLGPDLEQMQMVSITIDPEHDTLPRLQAYARKFKAGPQWWFLTGELDDIVAVQKAFNGYVGNKRFKPLIFIRTSSEKPWFRFEGLMSAADLVIEYRRAKILDSDPDRD